MRHAIERPSEISRIVRRARRGKKSGFTQNQLARKVTAETDETASRDQIARLESSRPLRFVPELLVAVVTVLGIPIRTVGRALTRDFVALMRRSPNEKNGTDNKDS